MGKGGKKIVHRSAKDGKFITEKEAKKNPDTSVRETVDKPKKK